MATTVLRHDPDTELSLIASTRAEPGGGEVILYGFRSPRGLPEHLQPSDAGSAASANAAFDAIVAWLKANPAKGRRAARPIGEA